MNKIALVICIHDGVGTHYCGVGTMARITIEALQVLKKRKLINNFEVYIITFFFDHNASYFDKKYFKEINRFVNSTGGKIYEIKLLKNRNKPKSINDNWGVLKWRCAGREAARIISQLKNKKIIFLAHDISFSFTFFYIPKRKNIFGYFIPHSTGILFKEPIRLPIDRKTFKLIEEKSHKVGYISEFMRKHLMRDYNVSSRVLVPIKNALVIKNKPERPNIIDLKKYNIDCAKRIIFSYGRCGSQKGFDILIKAYKRSKAYLSDDYQLILLAPADITGNVYVNYFSKLVNSVASNKCVWIKDFVDPLPFLKSKNLDTVVFASRFECAPITPMEVCFHSPSAKILYSKIEPFNETLKGLQGTLRVSDYKINSWVRGLNKIISKKNIKRRLKMNSYENNLFQLLKNQ